MTEIAIEVGSVEYLQQIWDFKAPIHYVAEDDIHGLCGAKLTWKETGAVTCERCIELGKVHH